MSDVSRSAVPSGGGSESGGSQSVASDLGRGRSDLEDRRQSSSGGFQLYMSHRSNYNIFFSLKLIISCVWVDGIDILSVTKIVS